MATQPPSPKRRHILSSINREECGRPPHMRDASPVDPVPLGKSSASAPDTGEPGVETSEGRSSKFRFKSSSSRSHRSSRHRDADGPQTEEQDPDSRSHRRHSRRHHHHRHKRRRPRSPTPPNPHEPPPLDPEAAFRESLFDAMADDEGAMYWEGVYGQPIHVYSNNKTGPEGELEQMTDDEYAAYVRRKMWEKTHQGAIEEKARREEQRRAREGREKEATKLTREMEESLRRGDERRRRKGWKSSWEEYISSWTRWDGELDGLRWPTQSGKREDVKPEGVREFLVRGLDPTEIGEAEFLAKLKEERVRWHPDKMQQRAGGKLDESAVRDVTAVFQMIDKLWADTRSKTK